MVAVRGEQGDSAGQRPVARSEDVADLGQVRCADAGAGLLKISVVVVATVVVGDVPDPYREPGPRRSDEAVDRRLAGVHRGRSVAPTVGCLAEVADHVERQRLRRASADRVEGGKGVGWLRRWQQVHSGRAGAEHLVTVGGAWRQASDQHGGLVVVAAWVCGRRVGRDPHLADHARDHRDAARRAVAERSVVKGAVDVRIGCPRHDGGCLRQVRHVRRAGQRRIEAAVGRRRDRPRPTPVTRCRGGGGQGRGHQHHRCRQGGRESKSANPHTKTPSGRPVDAGPWKLVYKSPRKDHQGCSGTRSVARPFPRTLPERASNSGPANGHAAGGPRRGREGRSQAASPAGRTAKRDPATVRRACSRPTTGLAVHGRSGACISRSPSGAAVNCGPCSPT